MSPYFTRLCSGQLLFEIPIYRLARLALRRFTSHAIPPPRPMRMAPPSTMANSAARTSSTSMFLLVRSSPLRFDYPPTSYHPIRGDNGSLWQEDAEAIDPGTNRSRNVHGVISVLLA